MTKIIVSGFPGVGKSFLAAGKKIQDSDSSSFRFSVDWPNNYIQHIKDSDADVILVSSHKEVRQALSDNNIFFFLAYPEMDCIEEYLERYRKRGSTEDFIKLVHENFYDWIFELQRQRNCAHLIMGPGQYLSDVLKPLI